jgi:hypothetical protein
MMVASKATTMADAAMPVMARRRSRREATAVVCKIIGVKDVWADTTFEIVRATILTK